jgi:metal-responsive CopG/Arc/MetJ family transcriptional regulator
MRLSDDFLAKVDDWRREQPIIPHRNEAIRQLVEWAIEQQSKRGKS